MAMNLPCKVHGCDSVIQSWPKLNAVQQAVLPGAAYQAKTLHGHEKCFEIAVDFTVQRVHIFKMSEHGPKRNMGPVGDLFCGGRQAAFVSQRRQRAHNFFAGDNAAIDSSVRHRWIRWQNARTRPFCGGRFSAA